MAVQGSLGITLNYQCRSCAYVPFLSFVELIWNHPKTFTLVGLKVVVATSGTAVISLRSVSAFGYPRHHNIDRTWVLARGTSAKIFPSFWSPFVKLTTRPWLREPLPTFSQVPMGLVAICKTYNASLARGTSAKIFPSSLGFGRHL